MDVVEWLYSIYIVILDFLGGIIKFKYYFNDGLKKYLWKLIK